MDFINLLSSAWPENNFWSSLIKIFDVGSYAWTIILFTVVLKLVLSPLDFLQRYFTNKTSRVQAKLQPELEKLKKRYGQNQQLLYQKQNELYKKHNMGMGGSCIVMLVYMAVTLTVFLTLFNSLKFISGYKIGKQYEELQSTYYNSYETEYYKNYLGIDLEQFKTKTPEEQATEIASKEADIGDEDAVIENKETAITNAQKAVVLKYKDIKDSWLWIKNIWLPDKASVKEISTYESFKTSTSVEVSKEEYNLVMGLLLDGYDNTNNVNGFYILSVMVVLVSFLSQWFIRKLSQPKAKNGEKVNVQQPGLAKAMMWILPIAMLLFTISSSAIFALYIITNSLMSTIITPISTVVSNKIEDKKELKRQEQIKVDYRR